MLAHTAPRTCDTHVQPPLTSGCHYGQRGMHCEAELAGAYQGRAPLGCPRAGRGFRRQKRDCATSKLFKRTTSENVMSLVVRLAVVGVQT